MDDLERSDSSTITRSELVERLAQAFPQLLPRDVELAVKTCIIARLAKDVIQSLVKK
jgi:integration host factor subunit beta